MDKEQWKIIEEFPDYMISSHGRVVNHHTDHIKTPSLNQQGIPNVLLVKDYRQTRRSIAPMVAHAFLPPPERENFDTPINIDGDRTNNHVDNLAWRPRWFAVKYHAQFKKPPWRYNGLIRVIKTGELMTLREAVLKFGVLETELIVATTNGLPVFPVWLQFEFVPA